MMSIRAKAAALTAASADTRADAEAWLESLHVPMIDVLFLKPDKSWGREKHVDDPATLCDTIGMTLGRTGWLYGLFARGDHWVLYSHRNGARRCPTREAAEMIAILGG